MKSCCEKKVCNKKKNFFLFSFFVLGLILLSYFAKIDYIEKVVKKSSYSASVLKYTKKKIGLLNAKNIKNRKNRKLSSTGVALNLKVEKFVLKNGLTVLLYEDHVTPSLLTYVQWVKMGSSDEPKGKTGYAHFFEHLLFKGTKNVSAEEFEITTSILGGSNNAFTSYDSTVYYMNLSSLQLEWAIKTESERMKKLILFDPSKRKLAESLISSERGAVTDEKIRREESSVGQLMWKSLFKRLYKGSNYAHSIIGSMEDLNQSTVEDFQDFYQKYYTPNNIVIAIGGDFNSAQAKKWIYQYYDQIPSNKVDRLAFTKPDPVQAAVINFSDIQKQKQLKNSKYQLKKILQSQFIMGYPGVSISHKDKYALELLISILSRGPAARLDKILDVQKNLVSSIYAGHYPLNRVGALYFGAEILPKSSIKEVLDIIQSEIKKIQNFGILEEELKVAKNQLQYAEVQELKTIHNKTMNLVTSEVFEGGYSQFFTKLDKYNLVSVKDIQRVAKQYLKLSSRVLVQAFTKQEQEVVDHLKTR